MRAYCNVGKEVLSKLLGLQMNHKDFIETSHEVINVDVSHCKECKWYRIAQSSKEGTAMYEECLHACASCPRKVMKTEVTYTPRYREGSSRAYLPRLKTNAIKLFLALHFFEITNFGTIEHVDLRDLTDIIGCNIKTTKSCLETLCEYNYISYSVRDTNLVNIYLPEYENYFKPGKAGGKGFLVLSSHVYDSLKTLSLTSLRIALRSLMEFDYLRDAGSSYVIEKSYRELRRDLPKYCKRNVIQRATQNLSLFITDVKDNVINFKLKNEYFAKQLKKNELEKLQEEIRTFEADFASDITCLQEQDIVLEQSSYRDFFADAEIGSLSPFFFQKKDVVDLAQLVMRYTFDIVRIGLRELYKEYILKKKAVKNLGGLTRSFIIKFYEA